MSTKTYVLLDSMNADAPVYQTLPDGTRTKVVKIRSHRPTMRQTFQDKTGMSRTIRYKSNSNFIFQDEQLEKEKLEANVPWTTAERRDLEFKFGTLVTNKKVAQDYLEAHPEFEGFEGTCDEVGGRRYKLLDEIGEASIKNEDTRKRVKAANKVFDLDLEAAQEMLIRLNGSYFATPDDLAICQNMLIEFIDDAEEAGLDAVLKENVEINIDDKTSILIGKLINAKVLSFDAVQGKISKKNKDGKWIEIREMSDEYSLDERLRLFSDFLNTADGKNLKNDLEKDIANLAKKTVDKKE
jgi:hypothetical protein